MAIAYSYVRFSTSEQRKGDSLRRQTELSERYAAKNGLTLDTSLRLHDLGISAYDRSNIERGALGGFLDAIAKGRIAPGSYLLVESLDRLSRDQVLSALEVFISILRKGITIVTLADNMVYSAESVGSNFSGLMFSITIMARAHDESAIKSHRGKAAWTEKRARINEKKLTAQCPRWMRLNANKTAFDLIPERVELVKEIINLAKLGIGQAQIAKRFNERKIPPFSKHGKGWHSSYIQKILTSTSLYGNFHPHASVNGKIVPNGDAIPDYYPALISKQEFYLLQNYRSQRRISGAKARKGTEVPNLLSGIVKCGYCGSTMILATVASKTVRKNTEDRPKRIARKVLICDAGRRGLGCYAVQWNYKDFETSFLSFCKGLDLAQLISSAESIKHSDERKLTVGEKLQSIESSIEDTEKRLANLVALIETGKSSTAILERIIELEEIRNTFVKEKGILESELAVAQSLSANKSQQHELIREMVEHLGSITGDQLFTIRAALAERIRYEIDKVLVYPAGTLHTPERIATIRRMMLDSGFSLERIDAYVEKSYQTEPKRQGRGTRGRYGPKKDVGRYFMIVAKHGASRILYPEFDNPAKVRVEMESILRTEEKISIDS